MKCNVFFILVLLFAFSPCALKAQTETIDLTAQGFGNGDLVETVAGVGCTVGFDLGSNARSVYPRYYDNGMAVRVYSGNTITVTATGSLVISEIDFTFGTGGDSNPITASTGSYSSGVWTGSAAEVTFHVGGTRGHRRLQQLVVTYESQVAPPTFNLYGATTTFLNSIQVRIEAESGATIRYTTDGTTPTGTSSTFVNNLTFTQTTTLKAIAIRDGMTSNVATLLLVKDAGLWSGTGTRTDPFVIDNTAKLDQLAIRVNAGESYENTYFVVTADIAYPWTTAWNNVTSTENNYTRIGTNNNVFKGHFDGGGHTISGIRMYYTSSYNHGLFGYIGSGAEVKNIVLENCRFTAVDIIGAIVGRADAGAIVENCHVMSNVCIHDKQSSSWCGGVVGYLYGGTVRGCTSSATLSIDENRTGWGYGGIVGHSQDGVISNCLAIGVTLPDVSHFTANSGNQRPLGAILGDTQGTQPVVSGCLYYDCHFGAAAATVGVGIGNTTTLASEASMSHTLTCVTEGVTLRYDDDDPNPDVVEVYPFGLAYGGKLYAAQGASVTYTPVAREGHIIEVTASSGTLTLGADGTYTLSMPAEDVTVSAIVVTGSCEIRYELQDSHNDGWEGAAIVVEDVVNQSTLATWTIDDGNSASGTLEVENGQFIRFRWVGGAYDSECSYVVYNAIGDEIFYGQGGMGTSVTHTVNCNACPNAHVLNTADITPTSAVVSWPERSSAYNIRYRPVPLSDSAIVILTVGNVWNDGTGYQMLLDADHTAYGTSIPETSGSANTAVYSESEYMIPENADGALTTQHVVLNNNSSAVTIPAGTYDWCITNPVPEGYVRIPYEGGRQNDFVFQAGYIYEFVVSLNGSNDRVDLTVTPISSNNSNNEEWTAVSDIHSPYTITGLSPDTWYEVQVQADCGDSGAGEWSGSAFFTTALPSLNIQANQWYAIAAPAHDQGAATLDVAHIGGLTDDHYDLFRYNEADGTWENQKIHADFTSFALGRGYIYRRTTDATLTFDGIPNSGPYSHTLTSSCLDDNIRGFNLMGNPYPHAIYKGMAFPTTNLATGFYSLQPDGTWLAHPDTDPIGIGQGVLVQVEGSGNVSLPFDDDASSPQQGAKSAPQHGLQFTLSGLGYTDVALALFDHCNGLRKVPHLNTEAPALSIPLASNHYAIASLHPTTEAFPLTFSGASGEYTIRLNPIGTIGYCHLVDLATGRDVDLLSQPTYTFTHSVDNASAPRFLVRLTPSTHGSSFAHQAGDRIVVNGHGTLQVFDMMGRRLFDREINTQLSIPNSQFPTTGVYLLRLSGDELKTQKIVIKK
jgi:hypothetical protein